VSDPAPAHGRWWVLLAIGAGTFMAALDGSVVNTTLPVIRAAFAADVARIEWVVTVYLLVLSSLLLSFGRLGDLHGHRRVYLSGFALFIAGSALCGLAPGVEALIAFRALQALGAAMLSSNSPAILTKSFPSAERGRALGLQATMTYLGLTAGPSLGGWLAQHVGWRMIFYINLPVGLAALALSARFVPRDRPAGRAPPFDLPGSAAFIVSLVALLLALNQGHAWGWTSPAVLALLAAASLALAGFVALERRAPHPMLDLNLFRNPLFSGATASAVFNYICIFSVLFLMPFYLIQGRGLNAAQAGLLLTAQPLVMAAVAPLSGALSDRIGTRAPAGLGMAALAAGLLLLSRLGPQAPHSQIILALAVAGLGTGAFISPNNSALMGAAPRARQGIAAGVLATARNVGMVLGVGLAGAIFTTVLAHGAPGDPVALFDGVQAAFRVAAGFAAAGCALAFARGG
jgi:EmrB/QacA subfamily drug resistance transporter